MKIYAFNQGLLRLWLPPKLLLIMRLIIVLLTVCFLQVSASTFGQRITLSEKNATLEKVLHKIALQADIKVVYADDFLQQAKAVTVKLHDQLLTDALDEVFKNQILSYVLKDNTIIVKQKEVSLLDKVVAILINIDIKGTVTDSGGLPLPGASVKVKGTDKGTVTNSKGEFYFQNVDEHAELEISYIGFKTQTLTVDNKTEFNVVLLPAEGQGLDEVVVVAFGTQKKETVTGAISSISTREIKQSPAANLAVTLAGRLPGLTTIQTSGEPGRDLTQLFLRGMRSLNGQSPLILVDGIPREITYVDPNEVSDVTILKDASATAMFGVRGANGVILVTTRRGTSEIPEISFSSEYGIQQFNRTPDPVNAAELAELTNQAYKNSGLAPLYSDETILHYRNQDQPNIYPDNNWVDMLTNSSTKQQRYNLNVNGSGKAVSYFVNAGYLYQDGLWKTDQKDYDVNSSLKRYNFRSNIDLKLNKNLKAFLNLGGYLETLNAPNPDISTTQLLYYLYVNPANAQGPLTPDGQIVVPTIGKHPPYGFINRSGYKQEKRTNITASYGMEHKLDFVTPGLSAKLIASFDARTIYQLNARQTFQRWLAEVDTENDKVSYRKLAGYENTPLSLATNATYLSYFNMQAFMNYNRTFNDHTVTGLLLYQQDERIEPNDRLPYRTMGLSSRFTYGFKNRYFLEFNAGYNGSEQFRSGNRFGFFPSISAGWVISNEKFFQQFTDINSLKIRGSYGKVGNDRLGSRRFLYLDDIKQIGNVYSGSIGQGTSITEVATGNPNIQWEVTHKANLGLEIGLFKSLNLNVDVFSEKVDNMLINRRMVSAVLGMSGLPPMNIGKMENKGFEMELKYQKQLSKDWSLLSSVNFNYAKNNVVFTDEPIKPADYAYRYYEQGFSYGQNFGLRSNGFWSSADEITASKLQYRIGLGNPRPGDLKYIDQNNDQIIDEKDIVPIGASIIPQYTFGAAFSVRFKTFDFSFLLQGMAKVDKFYGGGIGISEYADALNVFFDIHRNAWTPERQANGSKITYPALANGLNTNSYRNDYFTWDASFIRLKNFEIGYFIPSSKKWGVQNFRVYVNAQNPITWDRLKTKSVDPEVNDTGSYPMQRIFNLGVNIVF